MMDQQWVKRIRDNKQFSHTNFFENYFLFFCDTAEREFYASGLFQHCSHTEFPLCVYVASWLVWRRCDAAAAASIAASRIFLCDASSYAQIIFPKAGIWFADSMRAFVRAELEIVAKGEPIGTQSLVAPQQRSRAERMFSALKCDVNS